MRLNEVHSSYDDDYLIRTKNMETKIKMVLCDIEKIVEKIVEKNSKAIQSLTDKGKD